MQGLVSCLASQAVIASLSYVKPSYRKDVIHHANKSGMCDHAGVHTGPKRGEASKPQLCDGRLDLRPFLHLKISCKTSEGYNTLQHPRPRHSESQNNLTLTASTTPDADY